MTMAAMNHPILLHTSFNLKKSNTTDLDPLNNAGMHPNNDESSWRIDGWIAPEGNQKND